MNKMKKKTFTKLCALLLCALFAPSAARAEIFTGPKATVDADSSALGIVRVRYNSVSGKRLKVRVTKGGTNYNYDLNQKGNYETYPLQMGEYYIFCVSFFISTFAVKIKT